jgi:hypothetical protein
MGCTSSSVVESNKPEEKAVGELRATENIQTPVKPTEDKAKTPKADLSEPVRSLKNDDDTFQPTPGFVVKILSKSHSYKYDKIFINVFYHPALSNYENLFSQEEYIILDNRSKDCLAYNLLISSDFYAKLDSDPIEKQKVFFPLLFFSKKSFFLISSCRPWK